MKSGDKCPRCNAAHLGVISSAARGDYQARYMRCPACGHRCKSVVRAEEIRRRPQISN